MSPAAAVAVARSSPAPAAARPAAATQTQSTARAGAMQNVATPAVTLASAGPQSSTVQASTSLSAAPIPVAPERSGTIQKVLDKFADWSNNIPGFRMLTIVLGFNPINMRATSRDAANLLRAVIELIPGGGIITQVLDSYGVINQIGAWLGKQISTLGDIGAEILAGLNRFLSSLGWSDLGPWNWGGVWDRAKQIFTAPITRLISFGVSVATDILAMVKQVILKPLAALAKDTRGYDLLKAILGEDPITGEKIPRNAENLIGGFMKFIGQEEVWENIKKGKAIPRAWTWFQGALKDLMGFVNTVPRKIIATLSSLTFQDILTLSGAFIKVAGTFVSIAGKFIIWGLKTSWSLLEIIINVVKPGLMLYIKKTGAALQSIIKNPLPFMGNLVKAAKLGFDNFYDNFGTHLKNGLINWLTGSLQGVYIPTALTLPEMGKFAMSILGITWAQIRGKIVKALGPSGETIMAGLETGLDIVVALVKGGPAAAWELIKEKLSDLKDQVVSGIISFVTDTVIKKAIPKLVSMFIPGAGFITAIISIYDTVMVFVEKISQIIQVVVAFIDSIVAIAGGNITAAANRVEKILGKMLSLAISFFAGFVGLGKVTDKILGVIEKVRASVDKALDKAVEWIVEKAKGLVGKAKGILMWWKKKIGFKTKTGESHNIITEGEPPNVRIAVHSEKTYVEETIKLIKDAAKNKEAKALQAKILDNMKDIEKARKAGKDNDAKNHNIKLDDNLRALSEIFIATGVLSNTSAKTGDGSRSNPYQVEWLKPGIGDNNFYNPFWLAPPEIVNGKKISQSAIENLVGGNQEFKYYSDKPKKLPGYDSGTKKPIPKKGDVTIGVAEMYRPVVGLVVGPRKKKGFERAESVLRSFNNILEKHGYDRSSNGETDGDHVIEMQVSGPDAIPNLWPLNSGRNRSAGRNLKNQLITIEGGSQKMVSELEGKYFKIVEFKA